MIFGLYLYLQAFYDLNSERALGYGTIGAIPWSSIREYATAFVFDDEQIEDLFYFVKEMDRAYLEKVRSDMDKK